MHYAAPIAGLDRQKDRHWLALRLLTDNRMGRRLTQDATKGDIMRRAWELARRSAHKFGAAAANIYLAR